MDLNPLPDYTEYLDLDHQKPEQYLSFAIQAIHSLRWHLVSATGNSLICHTEAGGAFGEVVTVKVEEGHVIFCSSHANEYYQADNQNNNNAALFKEAIARIIKRNQENEKKLNPLKREKFGALVPSKTYLVSPVLIYLNTFIFICMVCWGISPFTPDVQGLIAWGGNLRPLTITGHWWRLVTYMFLHAGTLHLLMNMFSLLYIGLYLEPLLGKFRFASAYLVTGICAGLMSIAIHANTVGVGASGAIFGMYGIFLAMLTTKHIEKTARNTMLKSILFFVVYNLISGIQGNIDNAAHIGGLISGVILGYVYLPGLAKHQGIKQQVGITAIVCIFLVALIVLTFKAIA